MTVHSILPPAPTEAVDEVMRSAGLRHVAHGDGDHLLAADAVTQDRDARAVIGPWRSRAVAEVVEITAPLRLPLFAPVATWVGVTRDDEPGSEDHPARHEGTVFRLVARDTVVAQVIADRLRSENKQAFVVAGDHEYGSQLDAQLTNAELPRVDDPASADVLVLAGLPQRPENDRVRALAPRPVIAFDGIQGEAFPNQPVEIAVVYEPGPLGVVEARRAAELVAVTTDLVELRRLGQFDANGDPIDPHVRFEPYRG